MKKKLILAIALMLCVSCLLSLASCGRKKKENETTKGTEQTTVASDKVTEGDDTTDKGEKTEESASDDTTRREETTADEPYTEDELESAFEITGEEVTLPEVPVEGDND